MAGSARELREKILELTGQYYEANWPDRVFRPGLDYVPVSGKVFNQAELISLVDASLDFWLTAGRFAHKFEEEFAKIMGTRFALLTNSGSSANLLAISSLMSPLLGDGRLQRGDQVITVATGFPTTVNPIIQNGLVPVFLDIDIPTYNIDTKLLEEAVTERTKAIVLAHTLGNPFNVDEVAGIAKKYDLWLIEDVCDAVGAEYRGQKVGTFGDLATISFYPAHHLTMGEGGAVLTSDLMLKRIVESFRDWGRDCWCDPGRDNTCNRRFDWKLGDLPFGYDHKYVYTHIGYNLKVTEMQAAIGLAQLEKLPEFISKRRENFAFLLEALADLTNVLILPEETANSWPSWFGFPITLSKNASVNRNELCKALEERKIQTRLLFGGNLIHQPMYHGVDYVVVGDLVNSNRVMHDSFWIGVYPGLSREMLEYVVQVLHQLLVK